MADGKVGEYQKVEEGRRVVDNLRDVIGSRKDSIAGITDKESAQRASNQQADYHRSLTEALQKYSGVRLGFISAIQDTKETADAIGIKMKGLGSYNFLENVVSIVNERRADKMQAKRMAKIPLQKLIEDYMGKGASIAGFLESTMEDLEREYTIMDGKVSELENAEREATKIVNSKSLELKASQEKLISLTAKVASASVEEKQSLEQQIESERNNSMEIEDVVLIQSSRANYARSEQNFSFVTKKQLKHQYRLTKIIVEQVKMVEQYSKPMLEAQTILLSGGKGAIVGKQYIDTTAEMQNTIVDATSKMQEAVTNAVVDNVKKKRENMEILKLAVDQINTNNNKLRYAAIEAIQYLETTNSKSAEELENFLREQRAVQVSEAAKADLDAAFNAKA